MARYSIALNVAAGSNQHMPSSKESGCKSTTGDTLTDDVYISWNASTVGTKVHLRALVALLMQRLDSGGFGLT